MIATCSFNWPNAFQKVQWFCALFGLFALNLVFKRPSLDSVCLQHDHTWKPDQFLQIRFNDLFLSNSMIRQNAFVEWVYFFSLSVQQIRNLNKKEFEFTFALSLAMFFTLFFSLKTKTRGYRQNHLASFSCLTKSFFATVCSCHAKNSSNVFNRCAVQQNRKKKKMAYWMLNRYIRKVVPFRWVYNSPRFAFTQPR